MSKRKTITFGGYEFPTKATAKQFIVRIRDRYVDGAFLDEGDHQVIAELLAMHPEAGDKIGSGIAQFSVATDKEFGRTRHFIVHRSDGTATDFSFHSCIDGRNHRKDRLEALRRAIETQIIEFRSNCFNSSADIHCPLLGIQLSPSFYHVDHTPPITFLSLVEDWLFSQGIDLNDVVITPPQDNQIVTRIVDQKQLESWSAFHHEHARLRLVSPRGNLSDAKRSSFASESDQ